MQNPDHSIYSMPIEDFLLRDKLPWEKNPVILMVNFRVVGEQGSYKVLSIGRKHTSLLSEFHPTNHFIVDGIGGLMGELMDMSIMFNMHKVGYSKKDFVLDYTVWLKRLEQGQESNIDADMVERFSRKICEDD